MMSLSPSDPIIGWEGDNGVAPFRKQYFKNSIDYILYNIIINKE